MEDGATLDKDAVSAALKDSKLGLASFARKKIVIPEAAYVLAVTGTR